MLSKNSRPYLTVNFILLHINYRGEARRKLVDLQSKGTINVWSHFSHLNFPTHTPLSQSPSEKPNAPVRVGSKNCNYVMIMHKL